VKAVAASEFLQNVIPQPLNSQLSTAEFWMNETLQQILVAAAIVAAVLYLVLRGRTKKGRGKGGCGCATKKTPLP
jgi:hypothetical protein